MSMIQRSLFQFVLLVAFLILIKIAYLSTTLDTTMHSEFTSSNFPYLYPENITLLEPLPSPKSKNFKLEDVFGWGPPLLKTFYNTTLSPPGIILHTKGGIGNQLFEYACSYALAKRKNWPLYIHYPKDKLRDRQFKSNQREFAIDKLTVPLDNLIHFNVTKFPPGQSQLWVNDEDWLDGTYNHSYKFLQLSGPSYCQSEMYWKEYELDMHQMFQFRPNALNLTRIEKPLKEITSTESVALHVRRGDFLRIDEFTFPTQFHVRAIHLMAKMLRKERNVENPVFFVFTDDVKYTKKKFKEFSNIYRFIYLADTNNTSVEDFFLMRLCKHIIFPNSTFSWWAAFLNKNKNKIVITSSFNPHYWKLWKNSKKNKDFYQRLHGTIYHRKEWIVIDPFSGGLVVNT
ncbi:unnamed protein product [Orchesella dallaii]|uniref:L-Fucosyltransferase n=1 Tax=Orchesella dallaii TaxID=48710 RepID=A0ABP1S6E7_9HEXA